MSYQDQAFVYNISQLANVDYYLVMGTILHESGANPSLENDFGAKGLMQITPVVINHLGTPGQHKFDDYAYLRDYAVENGANINDIFDPRYNITLGVSSYADWSTSYSFGNDIAQVVNHYGEGSTRNSGQTPGSKWILAPSTYEILYTRDVLAQQKKEETWYMGDLYYEDGTAGRRR